MNLDRLATDLAYWESVDPTGGEATHYNPECVCPWLREEPLSYSLDRGVWGKYDNHPINHGARHIAEAIPKPVEKRVAWDAVEWPIPVGQWAIARIDGVSQDVQITAHVVDRGCTELIAQGTDNWDFFAHRNDFEPFPNVVQERKRQEVLEELEQWFQNAVQPFHSFHEEIEEADLARQILEDVDFFKKVLEKL